ncbi:MAG: hypothetical protein IPF55_08425 [Rhodoferax sp.]|nr:hypothetical protein [Rhodoferax sp.]
MYRIIAFTIGFSALLIAGCGGGTNPEESTTAGSSPAVGVVAWPPVSTAAPTPPPEFVAAKKKAMVSPLRALPSSTNDQFFDWVEQMFPSFFPTHQTTVTTGAWAFRAYGSTAIGVNEGIVYVFGGAFGKTLVEVGAMAQFDSSPLTQATGFLASYDASWSTAVPSSGAAFNAFNDGCFLDSGYTKPVSIASFDEDLTRSTEANKYRIGATRTAVQVLADRTSNNGDGSTRRELDIQYQIKYADGTTDTDAKQTLIWGSSFGSTVASGTVCATPTASQGWRVFGNREVVDASVRSVNQRNERYSLATGAPLTSAVDYSKYVQFRVSDPSNFVKYVVVTGPGLPSSGLKMVSVRLLRDDPLFAGKRGNYVDWRDTDSFRLCRADASGTNLAANAADCVTHGGSGNMYGAYNKTPAALDSAFDTLGFVAGGSYRIAVYNDDGWKSINGQASRTPIATHTKTLSALPYSAVVLGGTGVTTDLFPRVSTSLTPVQIASVIRSKGSATQALTWTALGAMPDASKFGWGDLYTFISGRSTATTSTWPQSRTFVLVYPSAGAMGAPSYTIPAAPSALVTPTYSESSLELVNRNGGRIHSMMTYE